MDPSGLARADFRLEAKTLRPLRPPVLRYFRSKKNIFHVQNILHAGTVQRYLLHNRKAVATGLKGAGQFHLLGTLQASGWCHNGLLNIARWSTAFCYPAARSGRRCFNSKPEVKTRYLKLDKDYLGHIPARNIMQPQREFWQPTLCVQRIVCFHWHIIYISVFNKDACFILLKTGERYRYGSWKLIERHLPDSCCFMLITNMCIPAGNLIPTRKASHPKESVHGYMYMAASIRSMPDALSLSLPCVSIVTGLDRRGKQGNSLLFWSHTSVTSDSWPHSSHHSRYAILLDGVPCDFGYKPMALWVARRKTCVAFFGWSWLLVDYEAETKSSHQNTMQQRKVIWHHVTSSYCPNGFGMFTWTHPKTSGSGLRDPSVLKGGSIWSV